MTHQSTRTRAVLLPALCLALLPFLVQASPEEGTYFIHLDNLGSTGAVSDAQGNVVQNVRYRPYGTPGVAPEENKLDSHSRFTGKPLDSSTGLYYFDARYLDPRLGRFLSADPARQIDSPYAYAGDAPLANVDPDGRVFTPAEKKLLAALLLERDIKMEPDMPSRRVNFHDFVWMSFARTGSTDKLEWNGSNWTTSDAAHHRAAYRLLQENITAVKRAYEDKLGAVRRKVHHLERDIATYRPNIVHTQIQKHDLLRRKANFFTRKKKKRKLAQTLADTEDEISRLSDLREQIQQEIKIQQLAEERFQVWVNTCDTIRRYCEEAIGRTMMDRTGAVHWRQ